MAEITLQENLWRDLVAVARKKKKSPEVLAKRALLDFLARMADEELLDRSQRAARLQRTSLSRMEESIKQHRRKAKL